jgi:hypothetical protein
MEPKAVTVLLEFQYATKDRLPAELVAEYPIAEGRIGSPGASPGDPMLAWNYDPNRAPATIAQVAGGSVSFDVDDQIEEASVLEALKAKDSLLLSGIKVRWEVTERSRPLVAFFELSKNNYHVIDSPTLENFDFTAWTLVLTQEQHDAAPPTYRLIAVVGPDAAPHVPKPVQLNRFVQGLNCQDPATIRTAHQALSCIASRWMQHH